MKNNGKMYSMKQEKAGEYLIEMNGEIVGEVPVDPWTGERLEGDYIIQPEFMADFEKVIESGAKRLTLKMNSIGGDCAASLYIHNRLRELSALGVEVLCVVDGVAMSGGSLIMCAADHVTVYPSSIIMIHKCWQFVFGAMNADELKEMAKQQDAWDEAQAAIYERKTGLSAEKIKSMMSATTYMSGAEAMAKGFADEMLDGGEKIAASADKKMLKVKGYQIGLHGLPIPEGVKQLETAAKAAENGGKTMAKNLEELRAESPELAASIEAEIRGTVSAEAVKAERDRLAEIDEIAGLYTAEQVNAAKYGDPCTAQELAFRAAKEAAKSGASFLESLKADAKESGAKKVAAEPSAIETGKTDKKAEAERELDAIFGKKENKGE